MVGCTPWQLHADGERPQPCRLRPSLPTPLRLPACPCPLPVQDFSQTESTMHNKMQEVGGQPAYRGAYSALYAATEPSLEGRFGDIELSWGSGWQGLVNSPAESWRGGAAGERFMVDGGAPPAW